MALKEGNVPFGESHAHSGTHFGVFQRFVAIGGYELAQHTAVCI
jgi:hypothetical protein